jgi:16S rRNA (guanine527-N7)-methyltransferase
VERAQFSSLIEQMGLELDQYRIAAFDLFEDSLYKANEVMNLTRVPKDECRLRHFIDSLLWHDLIFHGAKVLDIGCGPGFPCWPLANARADLTLAGLDSSGKMLGFLRTQSLPNLHIIQCRSEESGIREEYDVVTGRALAPLAVQLEVSAAPCNVGGLVIPMRAASDEESIAHIDPALLGLRLRSVEKRLLPIIDAPRLFPVYEKIHKTPAKYPRRWGEIKKAPLFSV